MVIMYQVLVMKRLQFTPLCDDHKPSSAKEGNGMASEIVLGQSIMGKTGHLLDQEISN